MPESHTFTGVMNGKETISILPLKCSRSESGWTNSPYEGPVVLEVNSYDPEPEIFLKKAYEAGCYLNSLL